MFGHVGGPWINEHFDPLILNYLKKTDDLIEVSAGENHWRAGRLGVISAGVWESACWVVASGQW